MGGIFHSREEIDEQFGVSPFDVFDASQIFCPACGFSGCEILAYPAGDPPRLIKGQGWSGCWFHSGKAECSFCGCRFSIEIEPPDDDLPEPDADGEEPERWN